MHAGPIYEVITSDTTNQQIGNYSLVLTSIGSNAVQGKLPSSFNATQLLPPGQYTAVYTYYPSSNFTQPTPLTITFQVSVRTGVLFLVSVL